MDKNLPVDKNISVVDSINGNTKIVGVFGFPVSHTMSPLLQNTMSKHFNENIVYVPFEVDPDKLEDAVKGIKALGAMGFNVTIPHKESIKRHLNWISPEVVAAGSVNTVKIVDGMLKGYSTDGRGFTESLYMETGLRVQYKTICVFGAGGSTRSIVYQCAIEGANEICIINRTLEKAESIAQKISTISDCLCIALPANSDDAKTFIEKSDIIINTSAMGMKPYEDLSPLSNDIKLSEEQIVYDIVYTPRKTNLIKQAELAGCMAINGMGMLFMQGVFSYEIWTGLFPDKDSLNKYYKWFCHID